MRLSIREADFDYTKSAERDALALEALAKKLHEYILAGQSQNIQECTNEIMDIANDLNDVVGRIHPAGGDLIPEGSRTVGLNKKADDDRGTCKECGKISHLQQGKCLTCLEK